jgi:alkyl hydroperoxide reductase subunit F
LVSFPKLQNRRRIDLKTDTTSKEYDLLIIGGGPAGLTAAAYAIRRRIETMLISEDLGGKMNYKFSLPDIETHPVIDGEELVDKFKSQMEYLDFARHLDKVTKLRKTASGFIATTKEGESFKGKAAIIATGVLPRQLNVPGEKEFLGKGVSYSAVSHAQLFIDMDVAVVGNGNQALVAAAELAQIAKKVYVIGVPNKYVNSKLGKKLKSSDKVTFLTDYEAKEIRGNASVERLAIQSKTKKDETEISVRGVFVELGYIANREFFGRLVKTTRDGRIIIDGNNQTSVRGLFAAGDVTDINAQQVVIAVGEGANAALSAYNYLLTLKQ